MIRVGAVGQIQLPASSKTSYDIHAEALPPLVPRQRGAVDVGSTAQPPAA